MREITLITKKDRNVRVIGHGEFDCLTLGLQRMDAITREPLKKERTASVFCVYKHLIEVETIKY